MNKNLSLYQVQACQGTVRNSDRAEIKTAEKSLIPTFYKASTEDNDLHIFVAAGWAECSSITDIADEGIKRCVEAHCKLKVNGEQLHMIGPLVKTMNTKL